MMNLRIYHELNNSNKMIWKIWYKQYKSDYSAKTLVVLNNEYLLFVGSCLFTWISMIRDIQKAMNKLNR